MKIVCKANETEEEIDVDSFIDMRKTLFCGQSFRWDEIGDDRIRGCVENKEILISLDRAHDDIITVDKSRGEFEEFWMGYFDFKTDYSVLDDIAKDDAFFKKCLEYGRGIRILRQDLWEMLVTFIISQRNNMPNIKQVIQRLCFYYGQKIETDKGSIIAAFPSPDWLAKTDILKLSERTHCGYRAEYILEAADFALRGGLNGLQDKGYEEQLIRLKSIKGVGDKVANCVILFGLHNRKAFPIDVWIQRLIDINYNGYLDISKYGEYAGLVQQYMFYYVTNHREEFK